MNIGDLIKDVEIYLDGQKDQYVDNDKSDHLYLFALDYNKFLDDFLNNRKAIFKYLYNFENSKDKNFENLIKGFSNLNNKKGDELILSSYDNEALIKLEQYEGNELFLSVMQVIYPSLDQQENIIAPLFFFKVIVVIEENEYKIVLKDKEPIFNKVLIKYLKKIYDIDISYDGYLLDFQKIYDEILEKDFNHLIRIEKAFVLSNLSWKKDYPYLNVSFHEGLLENFSLNHFFTKNKNQNTIETKHIFSNDFILNKIFYNLKFSNCLILNVENENIKEYVSTKIILESLLNKKNVGIFTKNTKLFDNIRKKYNIDKFIFYPYYKENYLLIDRKKWKTDNKNYNVFGLYKKYFELQEQKNETFSLPLGNNIFENVDMLINYSNLKNVKFDIELEEYDEEDLLKDKKFFSELNKLNSLKHIPLSAHPFYGLTSRANENTYNNFIELITKTLNDIEIFKEKIDELDFEKLKVDKIKSLKDYFRLEKHFLVLKQYKEAYFPYIQMETNYYPQNELIEIINKYNMLSSSKSTIDLYAEPEFWGYNIEQLVADYNENGRIHRKAVDTLIHFEKNPDRKNINFFVRLINIYLNNQKELKIMQNDLYQKNIDASTIDKAKEAYDAFEYRRTLDTHVHLYDDIDFKNNKFIRDYLENNEFRSKLQSEIFPILEKTSRNLENDYDNLKMLFDSGEQKDYELMSFSDVENLLIKFKSIDYKIYEDAYKFSKISNETSLPLKEVINDIIENNQTFDNLELEYFSSLVNAYKKIELSEIKDIEDQIRIFKPLWRTGLKNNNHNLNLNIINSINKNIYNGFEDEEFKNYYLKITKLYNSYSNLRNLKMITSFQDFVKIIYPLTLIDEFDEYNTAFVKDIMIVDNIENVSEVDWLNILLTSKSIILLSNNENKNIKINNEIINLDNYIPEINYNFSTIINYIDYSIFSEKFLNLIKHEANKLGLIVKKDYCYKENIYPLVIARPGIDKPQYLLIPENGIKEKEKYVASFFPVISNIYDIVPIEVSAIFLALITEKTLKFITETVKMISDYYVPDSKQSELENKEKYIQKLEELYDSFIEKTHLENLEDTDEITILSALPIRVEEKDNYLITIKMKFDILMEQGKIYEKDDFYYPSNPRYICLHKNEKDSFILEELIDGILKYLFSFSFLYKQTLKKELSKVLNIDIENEYFSDSYEKAITILLNEEKISISENEQLSIYKKKQKDA